MNGSEATLTRRLCKELEKRGAFVFAIVGGILQEPGWPDRYIAHKKWSGWVEFKKNTKVSEKQAWIISELRKRGVNAVVVRFGEPRIGEWSVSQLLEQLG